MPAQQGSPSLLPFVNNQNEYQIVKAIENFPQLKDTEKTIIHEVIIKWKVFLGISDGWQEKDDLLLDFIQHYYYFISIAELNLAIELSVARKLSVDVELYNNNFSPLYAGKIITAYLEYKKIHMKRILEKRDNSPTLPATPQQEMNDMIIVISSFYDEFKKTGDISDEHTICYDFLIKKKKLVTVDEAMLNKAMDYGREKFALDNPSVQDEVIKKAFVHVYARNWVVKAYFETVDITGLKSNITTEDFT